MAVEDDNDCLPVGPFVAHVGPVKLARGTLTSADKQVIRDATECTANTRGRGFDRVFTVCGPCKNLDKAIEMAEEMIEKNGKDGGRSTSKTAESNKGSLYAINLIGLHMHI